MVQMRKSQCGLRRWAIFRPLPAFLLNKLVSPGAHVVGTSFQIYKSQHRPV